MKPELVFIIQEQDEKLTLRQFFQSFYVAKKTIEKMIKVTRINQNQNLNGNEILKIHDQVIIDFPDLQQNISHHKDQKPIQILYEDDDLVVVEKEISCLVYDDTNQKDHLTGRVQAHYASKGYPFVVLPAHRLDVETSGMILFAKHPLALSYLSHQFEAREITKIYECLVLGYPSLLKRTLNQPIGRDRHSEKMRVSSTGDPAITHYQVIAQEKEKSRLSITIESGRKHQIRVHLSHIGYPIMGDILYGGMKAERMMLHFKEVSFIHPRTHQKITIQSNVPF